MGNTVTRISRTCWLVTYSPDEPEMVDLLLMGHWFDGVSSWLHAGISGVQKRKGLEGRSRALWVVRPHRITRWILTVRQNVFQRVYRGRNFQFNSIVEYFANCNFRSTRGSPSNSILAVKCPSLNQTPISIVTISIHRHFHFAKCFPGQFSYAGKWLEKDSNDFKEFPRG